METKVSAVRVSSVLQKLSQCLPVYRPKAATPNKRASGCSRRALCAGVAQAGLGLCAGLAALTWQGALVPRRKAGSPPAGSRHAVIGDRPCPRRVLPYPTPWASQVSEGLGGLLESQEGGEAGGGQHRDCAAETRNWHSVCLSRAEGRELRAREAHSLSSSLLVPSRARFCSFCTEAFPASVFLSVPLSPSLDLRDSEHMREKTRA